VDPDVACEARGAVDNREGADEAFVTSKLGAAQSFDIVETPVV
jgi:hypothetical protein